MPVYFLLFFFFFLHFVIWVCNVRSGLDNLGFWIEILKGRIELVLRFQTLISGFKCSGFECLLFQMLYSKNLPLNISITNIRFEIGYHILNLDVWILDIGFI